MESVHLALHSRPDDDLGRDWSLLRRRIDGERWLFDSYTGMLAASGPVLGRVLAELVDADGAAAVFHCHAGKDRTGMSAALLLTWLDVEREAVIADYALSAELRSPDDDRGFADWLRSEGACEEAIAGLVSSPGWVMADVLGMLDETYGGIEAYLRGPAGMDRATLEELRRVLVR
jgi:protein-tyrosine phosphatase